MYTYINTNSILNFYKYLKFTGFKAVSPERKDELDALVEMHKFYFTKNTSGKLALITLLSERLTTSPKNYGLLNGDEQAYFFVKMVDPELQHLAVYEAANNAKDIKELAIKNFGFYDKYLVMLEKYLNKRFQEYDIDDLWDRDNIKR